MIIALISNKRVKIVFQDFELANFNFKFNVLNVINTSQIIKKLKQ